MGFRSRLKKAAYCTRWRSAFATADGLINGNRDRADHAGDPGEHDFHWALSAAVLSGNRGGQ
jgi:hypothetical protein